MVAANPNGGFNSYWPMPFRQGARLTIENLADHPATLYYQVTYAIDRDVEAQVADAGYLHAQYRRSNLLPTARPTRSWSASSAAATTSAPASHEHQQPGPVGRGRDHVLHRRGPRPSRWRLADDLRNGNRGLLRGA